MFCGLANYTLAYNWGIVSSNPKSKNETFFDRQIRLMQFAPTAPTLPPARYIVVRPPPQLPLVVESRYAP